MEKQILEQVNNAIHAAILQELVGYNKPLNSIVDKVIVHHSEALFNLVNDEFSSLLNSDGFKENLCDALNKKLAKTLIDRMGGELEKQVNQLKQNPQTRAKITIAIDKIISEM